MNREIGNRLSTGDGMILIDNKIVVPLPNRSLVLHCLHSACQGIVGMTALAIVSLYGPGMHASIAKFPEKCRTRQANVW